MSVLVETSAWVEFFRATGSAVHKETALLANDARRFVTCGPVRLEVAAGARSEANLEIINSVLDLGAYTPVFPHHFDDAAAIYRQCRARGVTVRSMVDCLIAAIALENGLELLHNDRDFDAIAAVYPLRIHPASAA